MVFCENCGKQLEGGEKFCDGCGTAVSGNNQTQHYTPPAPAPISVPVNTTTIMAKTFRCSSCGNSLDIPKNPRGTVRCPYCKNECVLEGLVKNAEIAAKGNITGGIPLTATSAQLHNDLVYILSEISLDVPLDVFDKIEVVREERYCVPAYLFYCNGTASFTYEAGNIREHKTAIDLGDRTRVEKERYTEWTQMSSNASTSAILFTSGNKEFAKPINGVKYLTHDPNQLIDVEWLDYPSDVVTLDYNFPEIASFKEYANPFIERKLKEKAEDMLDGKMYCDLTMGGCKIEKEEVKRVFLGLYRIIYKYDGKEYMIWIRGDGEKILYEDIPTDSQRMEVRAEKQYALESISPPKTGWLTFGIWMGVIGALFTFGISLILTIICAVIRSNKKKEYKGQQDQAQKDIDDFNAPLSYEIQRFKSQQKALRGIYEKVSGDASAFE